jgi:hypothetical protein
MRRKRKGREKFVAGGRERKERREEREEGVVRSQAGRCCA